MSPLCLYMPFSSEPHEAPTPSSGWSAPVCHLLCQPNHKLDRWSPLNDAHIYRAMRTLNCTALWLHLEGVRVGSQVPPTALLMTVNFERSRSPNEIPKAIRTDVQMSGVVCDNWRLARLLQSHWLRNRITRPSSGQLALEPRVLSSADKIQLLMLSNTFSL